MIFHHDHDLLGHLLQSVGLAVATRALAPSGCRESQLEQLQVAFVAETPGFEGKKQLQHNRKLGPSLLHWLRTLGCSLHQLSDELEAPAFIT